MFVSGSGVVFIYMSLLPSTLLAPIPQHHHSVHVLEGDGTTMVVKRKRHAKLTSDSCTQKRSRTHPSCLSPKASTGLIADWHPESPIKLFPLLELPEELRLVILRHIVVLSESLHDVTLDRKHYPHASRNYNSALAVLATCKKLRDEGLPLFYRENTFEILLFAGRGDGDTRTIILGHELQWFEPPDVLTRMRQLNIELRGWPRKMDEDDTWSDRRMLHYLCETLTDAVDLSQLSLTVRLNYPKPLTRDNDLREKSVLRPLAFLRRVKAARVDGVDRSYAAKLERLMVKQERIENIWKMKTAFQDWCVEWTGDTETDLDGDATEALYACNVERFKNIRARVMREQGIEDLEEFQEVFHYDL